jgi:hypothetical protein
MNIEAASPLACLSVGLTAAARMNIEAASPLACLSVGLTAAARPIPP